MNPMAPSRLARMVRLAWMPALALGVAVSAHAQTTPTDTTRNQAGKATAASDTASTAYRALRASKVIGSKVHNTNGEDLGKIADMVVDMSTGNVRYAILEFDPGILKAEKLFAVPTTKLRLDASRDRLVYDMSEARLEQAVVPRGDWNTAWRSPGYLSGLDKVWGVTQPSLAAGARRVSDLIGKDVNNREGKKIGELEELVINMATQKVHYAVLEFDPSLAAREQNFAFPLKAFNLTADRDELILDVDKARLQAMKGFTDARYSSLNDRVWVADIERYFVTVVPAAPTAAAVAANTRVGDLFTRLDDDKNGWLSKAEVKDSADVDRYWTRMDKDNDDRISRAEFVANYTIEAGNAGMPAAPPVNKQ